MLLLLSGGGSSAVPTFPIDFTTGVLPPNVFLTGGVNGSRVNSSGNYVFGQSAPRFDYTSAGVSRGVLVETTRFNNATNPTTPGGTGWGTSRGAYTQNITTSPSGATDAASAVANAGTVDWAFDKFEGDNLGTSPIYLSYVFKYGNSQYIWVRDDYNSSPVWVSYDVQNGTVAGTLDTNSKLSATGINALGNGWYECWMIVTPSSSGAGYNSVYIPGNAATPSGGNITLAGTEFVGVWAANNQIGTTASTLINGLLTRSDETLLFRLPATASSLVFTFDDNSTQTVTGLTGDTDYTASGLNRIRIKTIALGVQTLVPSIYTDPDTFYSPVVGNNNQPLLASLYTDADTFFTPVITTTRDLTPSLYADADTFFTPAVTQPVQTLSPALFTDADTFFSPSLSLLLTQGTAFSNTQTFFTPVVLSVYPLTPSLFTDGDTFFNPTQSASNNLLPSLFVDSDLFYSAVITTGSVNLSPSLYADIDTFYAPTISTGGGDQPLTPSLYADADSFFTPTVSPGVVTLAPSLYVNVAVFLTPAISTSTSIQGALYSDADTFYVATVGRGTVNLAPSLYVDPDVFYAPSVLAAYTLTPALFVNGSSVFNPSLLFDQVVLPPLFIDPDVFFSPTMSGAGVSSGQSINNKIRLPRQVSLGT